MLCCYRVGSFVRGRWRCAKMPAWKVHNLRKAAILSDKVLVGADWTKGEWDPRWEKRKKATLMTPPKGPPRLRFRAQK